MREHCEGNYDALSVNFLRVYKYRTKNMVPTAVIPMIQLVQACNPNACMLIKSLNIHFKPLIKSIGMNL